MRVVSLLAAISLTVMFLGTGSAHAVVIVFGQGLGQDCYSTAELGDPTAAFDTCTAALSEKNLTPHDRAASYINRSVVRLRVRDYPGALSDTEQSIALNPTIAEAYVNHGAALLGLERPKEALQDFNKAIAIGFDKLHFAYYNRGLAKEHLNDIRGAYADYKKALELDPTFTLAADELTRFRVTGMMSEKS